ncbi:MULTISPECIES: RsmF rRNA methyltransferase first C-terminal domain-containing protein [Paenibacillus]|uniref:RsmF rRNA methyltransferase first C-terminal domain-containing protein n=1 Tax=Paenibacillus residui TaxID=629724 RepID=A0ABW3DD42_9BACL
MTIELPEAFIRKMKSLLKDEFQDFYSSYNDPRHYGVRINTLKVAAQQFATISPFALERVPWCPTGFYYPEGERPGKHPYYHAGLYYIQEPSAMLPVELLEIRPGDRVLDLCAAPGGKTTQIAAKLQGTGLVVANDNQAERVKALVKNVEMAGIRNAIVLNELPEKMITHFADYFDKILIDAPCSGEGMFRKEPEMAAQWEKHSVERCSALQKDILESAAMMLTEGGRIVYSTCTFSPEENEAMIVSFLKRHPEFRLVPVQAEGCSAGRADWSGPTSWKNDDGREGSGIPGPAPLPGTVRLWPHLVRGEGHFAAVLEKAHAAHAASADEAEERDVQASVYIRSADEHTLSVSHAGQIKVNAAAGRLARKAAGPGKRGHKEAEAGRSRRDKNGKGKPKETFMAATAAWEAFIKEHLTVHPPGELVVYGDRLYLTPAYPPALDGLKVSRPGWYVGTIRHNRFIPSHALAMGLKAEEAVRRVNLSSQSMEAVNYLRGDTLPVAEVDILRAGQCPAKGWCLVCIDGYAAGWGKWQDGILKNEYPPGWRMT